MKTEMVRNIKGRRQLFNRLFLFIITFKGWAQEDTPDTNNPAWGHRSWF